MLFHLQNEDNFNNMNILKGFLEIVHTHYKHVMPNRYLYALHYLLLLYYKEWAWQE